MGLDMYLYAEKFLPNWEHTPEPKKEQARKVLETLASDFEWSPSHVTVKVEVGYWRKANAIHQWFVDNVQGGRDECQMSLVERDKLEELRDICVRVMDNSDSAEVLLPTHSGFFFGNTEYDEWYFNNVKKTVQIINNALKLEDCDFYYQSSW